MRCYAPIHCSRQKINFWEQNYKQTCTGWGGCWLNILPPRLQSSADYLHFPHWLQTISNYPSQPSLTTNLCCLPPPYPLTTNPCSLSLTIFTDYNLCWLPLTIFTDYKPLLTTPHHKLLTDCKSLLTTLHHPHWLQTSADYPPPSSLDRNLSLPTLYKHLLTTLTPALPTDSVTCICL